MHIGDHAANTPDKLALVIPGSGYTQTFAELNAAANRLSQLLRSVGLQPGDHVALCMENHDRYLEVLWGCHFAGVIYTATSSRLTSAELTYILNDCNAKAFITSHYKAEQAAEILAGTPGVSLRLMLDGSIPGYEGYEEAVSQQSSEALPNRIAGTDMLYSSGTTGDPKPIVHGHGGVLLEHAHNVFREELHVVVELVDAVAHSQVVHGVADQFGSAWGWILAGGFALVKALELDLLAPSGGGS